MGRAHGSARLTRPEHEHLVAELAALPESERRAIVREADEKTRPSNDAEVSLRPGESLEQLEAALASLGEALAPRVEDLAEKSTSGALTPDEHREYTEIVEMTDALSLLRLKARRL